MPVLSVILPVYNGERYLIPCLDSVKNQTLTDLEILCIDDGSTDSSADILCGYAREDQRFRVFFRENQGVSQARNYGLKKAAGNYVLFVDADDWIDAKTCEVAVREARETGADVILWSYVKESANTSRPKVIFQKPRQCFEGEEIRALFHRRMIGLWREELRNVENADALCPVWGKLYRRELLESEKISFLDLEKIGTYEDGLFNLQVFGCAKRIVCLKRSFYHYRKDNQASITSCYKENLPKQWDTLFDWMENYIKENRLSEAYAEALQNRICFSVIGLGLNLLKAKVSLGRKMQMLGELLGRKGVREAFGRLQFSYLPFRWKVFFGCAKYRIIGGVYGMLLYMEKRRG